MIRGYTVNLPLYLIRNRFSEVNRGSEVPNVSYLPVVRWTENYEPAGDC